MDESQHRKSQVFLQFSFATRCFGSLWATHATDERGLDPKTLAICVQHPDVGPHRSGSSQNRLIFSFNLISIRIHIRPPIFLGMTTWIRIHVFFCCFYLLYGSKSVSSISWIIMKFSFARFGILLPFSFLFLFSMDLDPYGNKSDSD